MAVGTRMVGKVDREGLGMTTYKIIINREVRRASVCIVYGVTGVLRGRRGNRGSRIEEGMNPEYRDKSVDG